ncbi:MAG: endonuclease III [Bdellovibrionaceae bacterium]|nr:endonuclease III [Pseudobdellovibrionaceae bacterium]
MYKADPKPHLTLKLIKKHYPDAHCELNHSNSFELLIATILSAQCTDERVNKVTLALFKKFPTPHHIAEASLTDLEKWIRPTGFYKNKAKNIKACCQLLVQNFNSKVPPNIDSLITLPGVGRKTANVVLGVAFNIPNGVVVDTHVSRLSQRLGFSKNKTPEKIELDLQKLFEKKEWIMLSHYLIFHGRRHCKARNPDCENCFLKQKCPRNHLKL